MIIDYIQKDDIPTRLGIMGILQSVRLETAKMLNEKEVIYLGRWHWFGKAHGENSDQYYIENVYIDAKSGKMLKFRGCRRTGIYKSAEPLFQIITPNICINIDLDSFRLEYLYMRTELTRKAVTLSTTAT